ncbi:DUF4397 domain-containing protein [Thermoleophilia bacterium SCSIO 60948]|nr:DUF4397 domain-containing protein [Thermoleophilia bacterium SCSIO 60948]
MKTTFIKRLTFAIALCLAVFGLSAGQSLAQGGGSGKAQVRFVHAVPGVGEAELNVGGTPVGSAGFGKYTDFASVPAGDQDLLLEGPDGLELPGEESFEAGESYTVVALAKGDSAELRSYEDAAAKPGKARVRMIHAAPEFGEPDIVIDGQPVAEGVRYEQAVGYLTVNPGTYSVSLDDPKSGKPVLGPQDVSLAAGSAATAFVVGSRGEEPRIVLAQDATALPSAAPETGFGWSPTDEVPLIAALLAAGIGAAAGSAGLMLMRRRHRADTAAGA